MSNPPAGFSAPKRRAVTRAAWAAPTLVFVAQAPAYAATVRDLALTVTSTASTVAVGTNATVSFKITNNSTNPTNTPTVLTVAKVAGLTLTPGTLPSGWTVVDTGGSYTITGPSMAVGQSVTLPFTASSTQPGSYTIAGTVKPISGETTTSNNSAGVTLTVTGFVDLKATLTSTLTTVSYVLPTTLTYGVQNVGNMATSGAITVTFTKPPNTPGNFTLVSAPAGWTKTSDTATSVVWQTSNPLAANATATWSYTFTRSGLDGNINAATFTNTITSGSGGETNAANNTASVSLIKIL